VTAPVSQASPGLQDGYVLTRRRIYILPTRQGLSFCAVALVMLIGAINYNNSLGYLLTFLLGSLALVSMLHTYRNLAGLNLKLTAGEPVFAGTRAPFVVSLDNSRLHDRYDVCVSLVVDVGAEKQVTKVKFLSIAADSLARVELHAATMTRGWFQLGRVTVSTRFPLGLFRAWCHLTTDARALVYPHPEGELALPMSAGTPSAAQGPSGQGDDDFAGLRNYVPGDSTRRIHWKSAARQQEISVKVFTGASAAEVKLRWAEIGLKDPEGRLSQLTTWVQQATRKSVPYALELPGESFPAATGDKHRQDCLRALALFGLDENA